MSIPAIILAAGRGERMRPLTDTCPKPLLEVRGQPLLAWHVQALVRGGFDQLVVNTAWLGPQIAAFFDCHRSATGACVLPASRPCWVSLSDEQAAFGAALETAGGIAHALPHLKHRPGVRTPSHRSTNEAFWVVAGDVFAPEFVFSQASVDRFVASDSLAHLWLVPNPAHNPLGDFFLSPNGLALNQPPNKSAVADMPRLTYSTIGLFRTALFAPPWCDWPPGNPHGVKAPLAPLLRHAMDAGCVSAEPYNGEWTDVGTPERLAELNNRCSNLPPP
jgi:N-acetyl-alpha-D-muramate 1-phosphate uridylyltransferase